MKSAGYTISPIFRKRFFIPLLKKIVAHTKNKQKTPEFDKKVLQNFYSEQRSNKNVDYKKKRTSNAQNPYLKFFYRSPKENKNLASSPSSYLYWLPLCKNLKHILPEPTAAK